MTNNDSSETIRKTPFIFASFLKHLPKHKTFVESLFLEWFIGFTEGDGSFGIQTLKQKTISSPNSRLSFVINQKDARILFLIRTTLGFGTVKFYKNTSLDKENKPTSYWRYGVSDIQGIKRLIHLFNGNLVLNKTNQRFQKWIESYNKNIQLQETSENLRSRERERISHLGFAGFENQESWMMHSAWLAGFTDAEGCFSISKRMDPKYSVGFRVDCRFILSQKNEKSILEKISQSFGGGHVSIKKLSRLHWRASGVESDSTSPAWSPLLTPLLRRGLPRNQQKVNNLALDSILNIETPTIFLGGEPNVNYRFECSNQKILPVIVEYFQHFELKTEKKIDFLRFVRIFFYLKTRKEIPWEGKVLKKIKRLLVSI